MAEEVVHWLVKRGTASDGDKDQKVSHQQGNITEQEEHKAKHLYSLVRGKPHKNEFRYIPLIFHMVSLMCIMQKIVEYLKEKSALAFG